jgi:hypothetical protein
MNWKTGMLWVNDNQDARPRADDVGADENSSGQ